MAVHGLAPLRGCERDEDMFDENEVAQLTQKAQTTTLLCRGAIDEQYIQTVSMGRGNCAAWQVAALVEGTRFWSSVLETFQSSCLAAHAWMVVERAEKQSDRSCGRQFVNSVAQGDKIEHFWSDSHESKRLRLLCGQARRNIRTEHGRDTRK